MMKAILLSLDHERQLAKAHEVMIASNKEGDADWHDMRQMMYCRMLQVVPCDSDGPFAGHLAIMDEEGLFNASLAGFLFCPAIGPQPYAGRILLMTRGAEGRFADAQISLETAENAIRNGYVSRGMARAIMRKLEEGRLALFPQAIVLRASVEI